jgi:cytoskeletal protein CcmA (bactofilin family)
MSSRAADQDGFRGYVPQTTAENQESISVIDQYSNFDGTYNSTRDLRIEGQVKGTIECRGTLHIAQGANVNASIEAENISVAGELDGEITCRGKLLLLPSGRVRGKINTRTLIIHEGAFYEGELEMNGDSGRPSGRSARTRSQASAGQGTSSGLGQREPASDEDAEPQPAAQTGSPSTFIRRFGGQEQQWDGARSGENETRENADS